VLGQVQQEFNPPQIEYAVLAEFAGMIVGASTWGILADIIGRKVSFNVGHMLSLESMVCRSILTDYVGIQATLFIAGIFGLAAGGGLNFVAFSSLIACMGFGVGGK
jgi:MFS family permease